MLFLSFTLWGTNLCCFAVTVWTDDNLKVVSSLTPTEVKLLLVESTFHMNPGSPGEVLDPVTTVILMSLSWFVSL